MINKDQMTNISVPNLLKKAMLFLRVCHKMQNLSLLVLQIMSHRTMLWINVHTLGKSVPHFLTMEVWKNLVFTYQWLI